MTKIYKNQFGVNKNKSVKKFFVWGGIFLSIFLLGILVAVLVDLDREFKKNNVGTFEISLTNEGVSINESSRAVEFRNIKIGQIETLKFNFVLNSITREQTFLNDESRTKIENGVYVRIKLSGEVFDINENGETQRNLALTNKMAEIISLSPSNGSNWQKVGNTYYYANGTEGEDEPTLVKLNDNIYSTSDIMLMFNTNIVDGTWYNKLVKVKIELEAVDHLSKVASSWRTY